jgi:hypothetical protein
MRITPLFITCTVFLLLAAGAEAQKKADSSSAASSSGAPSSVRTVLTADSLASGNWKNVLTSFFQLSFNNLTSNSKSVSFTANPYAVMLRADSTLALDTNYAKLKVWRKLNVGFALNLDTSYHFHGFASGVKYALINKRDSTVSKWLFKQTIAVTAEFHVLFDALLRYEDANYIATTTRFGELLDSVRYGFSEYNPLFQQFVLGVAQRNKLTDITSYLKKHPDSALAKYKSKIDPKQWAIFQDSLKSYTQAQLSPWADTLIVQHKTFSKNLNAFFRDTTKVFNTLDTSFQSVARKLAANRQLLKVGALLKNPNDRFAADIVHPFDSLKAILQNQWLWTVGVSDTTYTDQFFFSNIVASTELLKGVTKPNSRTNLELDIKASVNWVDDSLTKGRNLQRNFFRFEPGFNWVIKQKGNKQSFLELAFSGQYNHFFSGWYRSEMQDKLYFNGTLRVRIFNDFWISLTFNYDPKTGNVLGFLNVTTNFSSLGSLLKGSKGG